MTEFFRRLQYLLNRRRYDRELASEMEFHREMSSVESPLPFGNQLRLREQARDAWGWTWLERTGQDLRYAARKLRKSPGFTIPAILILAIGIGLNVAAFGFFNLMVLRPMPVRDPASIFRFQRRSPSSYSTVVPYPEMAFMRDHSRTLSAVIGVTTANVSMEGEPKQVKASFVTPNIFREVGVSARFGRTFDAWDESSSGAPPLVLSYGFWQSHFGADPLVIGKTIHINNKPALVIGIAPTEFSGLTLNTTDFWTPIEGQPYFVNGSALLTDFSIDGGGVVMWARVQPGLSSRAAEDELRSLAAQLRHQHPNDIWENETLRSSPGGYATSMTDGNSHGSGSEPKNVIYPVTALMGTLTLLILAVTCGNLGSLLLARGVAREREIAIRLAIGAGRGRLVRQLFTESLVLALAGSAAGLLLGYIVLRSLMVSTASPAWLDPTPDWRVIVFSISVGFIASIAFGLTPALQIARQRHRATFMRQFLLGAQVAGSCVLVIVSGLLVRAISHAVTANPGFEYQRVVAVDPGLSSHGYSPARAAAWLETFRRRVISLPGVQSVAYASTPALGHRTVEMGVEIEGRSVSLHANHVDPEYFRTMGIPLLQGRNLKPGDTRAIIISQSLAARQWPGQNPLGKQIPTGKDQLTVVGIAGDARGTALQDPDAVEGYFLAGASDLPIVTVLVKVAGAPEGLLPHLLSEGRAIDPAIFPEVEMMKTSFRQKLKGKEYTTLAVTLLGVVALLLASLGIVGLVAYAVSQRTKEIGIRMALGAGSAHILSLVLRHLSLPIFIGLLVGVGGAAALSSVLRRELYGVSSLDPLAYACAIGVFVIVAGLASLIPALRALRLDPLIALRYE